MSVPARADVVVVGAGVLGASAAFHLAAAGRDVLILDRGPIGAETSSQGAGFLCAVRPTVASSRLAAYSTAFYRSFSDHTGYPIDLHLTGGLRVALGEGWMDELRREAAAAEEIGVDVQVLGPREVQAAAPSLDLSAAFGGTLVPGEGYVTATRDVASGFTRAAVRRGAQVCTHVEVETLTHTRAGLEVQTDRGRVQAGAVVLAANAGLWPIARALGRGYAGYPLHHECAVYALAEDLPADLPTVRVAERDIYLRHEAGGVLVGGVGNDPDGPHPDAEASEFRLERVAMEPRELRGARERAGRFVPGLERGVCFREQRGLAMVAPDLEPVAGEWAPGIFAVTADLRGVQTAPALGLLVAQLVGREETEFDPAPYAPDRFRVRDGLATRAAARDGFRPRSW